MRPPRFRGRGRRIHGRECLAEQIEKLTGTTRVIVSFGARDGGFELTLQLRQDIMDRYGKRKILRDPAGNFMGVQADESFCYLDAVTLKNAEGTTYEKLKLDKKLQHNPKRAMAIDLNKMANPFWDTYYPAAVANAAVMIFQVTQPWMWSAYCLEELGWFVLQSLANLERGRETPVIFMVFGEAEKDLKKLLQTLRRALKSPDPGAELADADRFGRMLNGLMAIQEVNMDEDPATFGLKMAMHQRIDRMLDAMQARIIRVPPGDPGFSFTDYYDEDERKILPQHKVNIGRKPVNAAYEHTFNFNYSITQEFERELFKILDEDLQKVNIFPVHPLPNWHPRPRRRH